MESNTTNVLTSHSQSSPAINALKEKISILFQQNEVLRKQILVYDAMVERLDILEKNEIATRKERGETIAFIANKFKILRIVSKYNEMNSLIGIYDEYNETFLHANASRRAMLIDAGCVFYKADGQLHIYAIEDYAGDPQKEQELLTTIEQLITEGKYIERLHFWQGCEMAVTKNAKIVLNFNKPYPSVYIKRKTADDEIFIEESSWHVDYIANDDFLKVIQDEHTQTFSKALTTAPLAGIKTERVSLSKKDYAAILGGNNELLQEYQAIDMKVLEALEECDVVVQMPYISPRADMLVKVSFGDSDKEELILSTC